MKKSVLSVLFLFWSYSAFAQMPPGSEFKTYFPNTYDFSGQARYYTAQGNYTNSGNSYDSLPSGGSYQSWLFDFGARTTVGPGWGVFGSATFADATAKNSTTTHTNGALSEGTFGTDFLLSQGTMTLIPELSMTVPFTKNDWNGDTTAIGDGAFAGSGRLIALIKLSSLNLGFFAGLTYRDQGLASLLPYGALVDFNTGRWDIGGDLRGYSSLGSDSASDEIVRNAYFCRTTGCAKVYDSYNSSLIQADLWLRMRTKSNWDYYVQVADTLTGKNTATGYTVTAGVTLHWNAPKAVAPPSDDIEPVTTRVERPPRQQKAQQPQRPSRGIQRPTRAQQQKRVTQPSFQEEVDDGVDQSLFEPEKLPPPPPVDAATQRKKAQQQMQDELNKTEMQIESKSNKNKMDDSQ